MSKEKLPSLSEESSIGLAEFIEQVKKELLIQPASSTPLLSVDQVELELQVTIHKEGSAGIQIQIIQAGGKLGSDDVHTVKVTLTPLLSKEERLHIYKSNHPELKDALERIALEGGLKGSDSDAKDLYG